MKVISQNCSRKNHFECISFPPVINKEKCNKRISRNSLSIHKNNSSYLIPFSTICTFFKLMNDEIDENIISDVLTCINVTHQNGINKSNSNNIINKKKRYVNNNKLVYTKDKYIVMDNIKNISAKTYLNSLTNYSLL